MAGLGPGQLFQPPNLMENWESSIPALNPLPVFTRLLTQTQKHREVFVSPMFLAGNEVLLLSPHSLSSPWRNRWCSLLLWRSPWLLISLAAVTHPLHSWTWSFCILGAAFDPSIICQGLVRDPGHFQMHFPCRSCQRRGILSREGWVKSHPCSVFAVRQISFFQHFSLKREAENL